MLAMVLVGFDPYGLPVDRLYTPAVARVQRMRFCHAAGYETPAFPRGYAASRGTGVAMYRLYVRLQHYSNGPAIRNCIRLHVRRMLHLHSPCRFYKRTGDGPSPVYSAR